MKTICIAGKNDIAVAVLAYCIDNYPDLRIVVVCNRNDSGVNSWQRSLLWFAKKKGIEILSLEDVYGIEDLVFLSTEFDRIIRPEKFLSTRLFNIHFSMLPEYKGCHTSVLPILQGRDKTGITFHRMDSGIDTGEIIEQKVIDIDPSDTAFDLYLKLIAEGTKLVIKNLPVVINGEEVSRPQSFESSTYYPIGYINYKELSLDVNATSFQIRNQVRAFGFRPYQLLSWNGIRYVECEITDTRSVNKPGYVIEDTDIYTLISTVDYDVKLYKDVLTDVLDAISEGRNDAAIALLRSPKIINAKNDKGWSPLTVAVYNADVKVFEYLVSNGADIFVKNNNGTTLLMYAKNAGINTGDWTIFRRLLELGLDPGQKDYEELTLKDYVLDSGCTGAVPDDVKEAMGIDG
ncbi:MAG: ankyrin repeat domain-containing protein [Clostridiales bacterium]|nr:ankyrin repeat domain-containing protein [Clostridiales bacterium]